MSNKKYSGMLVLSFSLLLLTILSIPVNCQDSHDDSGVPAPLYDDGCESLMKAMHKKWTEADGEAGIVYCNKLIWALLLNPNAFYQEFEADTVAYGRFLECIENNAFRNYNDTTTTHLERLRLVAIDRLQEQTYSIDSSYIELHEQLIDKIKHVKPTFVD